MKGTPQLSDFAYPSQVESVLTAFTPQSPTFSAQAQFCLSDYHYLNFIQIQIIGSSTIFQWISIDLPIPRGKKPNKIKCHNRYIEYSCILLLCKIKPLTHII